MGQKVNPNGFRVGVIKDWNTRWYASKKDFSDYLVEDKKIRDHLKKVHYAAGVAKIDIERAANKVTVSIHTARPGMLIGKGGVGVDAIKADVSALMASTQTSWRSATLTLTLSSLPRTSPSSWRSA